MTFHKKLIALACLATLMMAVQAAPFVVARPAPVIVRPAPVVRPPAPAPVVKPAVSSKSTYQVQPQPMPVIVPPMLIHTHGAASPARSECREERRDQRRKKGECE